MPDIAETRHLLLDPRVVERAENARLVPGRPAKDPRNPLFVEDRPWEVRFDNLYANVIFDEHDGIYKAWYSPFIMDEVTTGTPPVERKTRRYEPRAREMGVCYAVSRDGVAWEKPDLGIAWFGSSSRNNIVMRNVHGAGVFKDPADADPSRRYKAFVQGAAALSPDGLHWSVLRCPEIGAPGDTHNNAFRDPRTGKFVGITRLWDRGQRTVGRTESDDFIRWTPAVEVLRHAADEPERQTYAHLVFPYAGAYIALVMLLDTRTDLVDCELAWSADAVRWQRICPGTPLIPRGPAGSFDCGCIYAAAYPIVRDDGILLYYGGGDDTHGSWRKGGFGLARLRPDGFAGIEPVSPGRAAMVVTRPARCTGPRLRVTADAAEGSLRVGVLDAEGLGIDQCERIVADVTDAPVRWATGDDLAALVDRDVRLAFELRAAVCGAPRLYAFRFT